MPVSMFIPFGMERRRGGFARGHPPAGVCFLILLVSLTIVAAAGAAQSPALTTIREIRDLSPAQAKEKRLIKIEATVTYCDAANQALFVRDASGSIFVEARGQVEYVPGQRLEIQGVSGSGLYRPVISSPTFTLKEVGPLPAPRRVNFDELQSGLMDCEWVEVAGRVRRANPAAGQLEILLAMASGRQTVWVHKPEGIDADRLVGSAVSLRGVCAGSRGERNELLAFDLFVTGKADLTLLEPSSLSRSEISLTSIGSLLPYSNGAQPRRARIRGRVTLCWPGRFVFVEDGSGALQIKTSQEDLFVRGEIVEAIGFPNVSHHRSVLEDSTIARFANGRPPKPAPRTFRELYARYTHGDFVVVKGRLADLVREPRVKRLGWNETAFHTVPALLIESDGWFFHAELPAGTKGDLFDHLEQGALVAVTGVCIAEMTEPDAPRAYRLLVESPGDIAVVERAPWWTPRRVFSIAGGAALLSLSALGWVAWFYARRHRQVEGDIRKRNEQIIRHQAALLEIARAGNADGSGIRRATELAARALEVGRASVWLFSDDHEQLVCRDLFIADSGRHENGGTLRIADYPRYFAALEANLTIDASRAADDPRTSEFKRPYLEPLGIGSMLDVSIRSGGRVSGAVCFEQLRTQRDWTMEEQNFAAAVADHVSLDLEAEERLKAEEALREAHSDLERRVFLRTSELAEAKERAESADRVKSAFLATMSHELRTPLNSILGFTGIMQQGLAGPLNDEQKKQLGMVMNSARHLLSLINDVLDISRIEAGQVELHWRPFDVRESIVRVMQMTGPLAAKKGLGMNQKIADDIGEIVADCRRFEQVLINLLNNAVKFTERGEVRVECTRRDGDLLVEVIDTGPGIKPEHMEILFKPFRQIDSGLTRQHEGSGLGLAICERLVKLMGGRLQVESTWQRGSKFSFTLPLAPKPKS